MFLDGTWSDANDDTNVVQIYRRVPTDGGGEGQELQYIKGVGTGRFDRLRGGLLGAGLDDTIRKAYTFIAARHGSDARASANAVCRARWMSDTF